VLVSVIIPAYNAQATLPGCIEACLNQTHLDREVIVVDDGSNDETARIAQRYPVHCVRQENQGPAAARNLGAREAHGMVLAFTDADCVPEPDWIERLVKAFKDDVAAVGGTYGIANPESRLARMIHAEIVIRHARLGEYVDFLGSFNVAYKRDAFERVGGFDPVFRMASAEDNDLAYRLQDAGYRLRFAADARVAHYHPTRLLPYLRTQLWHGYWRVVLYRKHPHRVRKGDAYAGPTDLWAPPLAAAAVALAPLVAASALVPLLTPFATGLYGLVLLAFVVLHLAMPIRMARSTRDRHMLEFADVACLRSLARAAGMVYGLLKPLRLGDLPR